MIQRNMLSEGTSSPCRPALTEKLLPPPIQSFSSHYLLIFSTHLSLECCLKSLSSYTIHSTLLSQSSVASSASSPLASFSLAMPHMIWPCCISRRIDFSFGLFVKPYLNSTQRNFLFPPELDGANSLSWGHFSLHFICLLSSLFLSSPSSSTPRLFWAHRNRAGMINATSIAAKR